MSDFPSTKYEALAMLYMKNQNLSGLTPKEILEKYDQAYEEIRNSKEKANLKTFHSGF